MSQFNYFLGRYCKNSEFFHEYNHKYKYNHEYEYNREYKYNHEYKYIHDIIMKIPKMTCKIYIYLIFIMVCL